MQRIVSRIFPDVFDPEFATLANEIATRRCAPRKDDRSILGWFTDNELRWGPDWRGKDELLTMFLSLPAGATEAPSWWEASPWNDPERGFLWYPDPRPPRTRQPAPLRARAAATGRETATSYGTTSSRSGSALARRC